jgi:ABC-2 type transport system permease protein
MRNTAVIAVNSIHTLFRVRSNLFFVFVMPLLLITVLGTSVATSRAEVRVVVDDDAGEQARHLVAALESYDDLTVTVDDDLDAAVDLVERGDVDAVVVVPGDYDQVLADGGTVEVTYLARPGSTGSRVERVVDSVLSAEGSEVRLARAVEAATGHQPSSQQVAEVMAVAEPLAVDVVDPDGDDFQVEDLFGFVAAQELLLFLFTISITASAALVEARRSGVIRRMAAAPVTPTEIVAGHLLGRYLVALVQAGFILVATVVLFGASWGSWPATLAVVAVFSLVSAAVAALLGSVAANENQSTAVGITLGLTLAAFGGSMVPLEEFPDGLRVVAHVTPHAWANDAFTDILLRNGGLTDVILELAVLTGFTAVTVAVGSFALRRAVS